MKSVKLIFPHQLFQFNPLFQLEGSIYLVEEFLFFKQYNFHKQKIAFHRASMKFYQKFMLDKGFSINYIQSTDNESDIRLLIPKLHASGLDSISIIDPCDNWLLRRIKTACQSLNIQVNVLDSPMFLNSNEDLETFFKPTKKKFFQTEFYKQERIRRNILIDQHGGPEGGQWTYDVDNRKKYPKNKAIVSVDFPEMDAIKQEAHDYVNQHFSNNIGELNTDFNYPTSFEESEKWLKQFLENRMTEFGDYEDAILKNEIIINHSVISPMLNIGLLTPAQILTQLIDFSRKNGLPINSLEGFIRQVIGWREFIRGVYISKGQEERTKNFWAFDKKIPASFYDGTTGILPIDDTIKKVLKTGYCHHIERLMILGNFMLLCEFDPDEVYRWFMELFIDAYDWVMVPNVYGMSQFADGGLMSSKPYVSGSNYLMKMSDYPKGEWQEIWDALFWRFLDKQRVFFLKNPRLSMLVRTFDKWEDSKKIRVHEIAEKYLENMIKNNH
jgi:deoxyribodipyrimidine photolyase-related protein